MTENLFEELASLLADVVLWFKHVIQDSVLSAL